MCVTRARYVIRFIWATDRDLGAGAALCLFWVPLVCGDGVRWCAVGAGVIAALRLCHGQA